MTCPDSSFSFPLATGRWLERVAPVPRPPRPWAAPHVYTAEAVTMPQWTEPLRVIYDHELVLFREGSYLLEVAGERHSCPAGSFAIVPPGRWHTSYDVGGVRGRRQWCHFDWLPGPGHEDTPVMTFHPDAPQTDRLRLAPSFLPDTVLCGSIQQPSRVDSLMGQLIAQQRSGSERDRLLSRATLLALLVELLLPAEPVPEPRAAAERLATSVRRLLDATAARAEPLPPIVPLLQSLGRSYAHLCRLFQQEYGISPLHYVHAARMGRARLLLAEGQLGIAEIAYRLGYGDPGHFTRVFRKVTGTTPTAYLTAGDGRRGLLSDASD